MLRVLARLDVLATLLYVRVALQLFGQASVAYSCAGDLSSLAEVLDFNGWDAHLDVRRDMPRLHGCLDAHRVFASQNWWPESDVEKDAHGFNSFRPSMEGRRLPKPAT
jgi:hypothetical protein